MKSGNRHMLSAVLFLMFTGWPAGDALSWQELGQGLWLGEFEPPAQTISGGEIAVVKIDPRFYRPAEVDILMGDPSKISRALGWKPKIRLRELIEEMIQAEREALREQLYGNRK